MKHPPPLHATHVTFDLRRLDNHSAASDSRPRHVPTPPPPPHLPPPPLRSVIISGDARRQINARRLQQVRATPKVDATASVMNESRREPSPPWRPADSSLLPRPNAEIQGCFAFFFFGLFYLSCLAEPPCRDVTAAHMLRRDEVNLIKTQPDGRCR